MSEPVTAKTAPKPPADGAFARALKSLARQPVFIVTAGVLLLSAVSLNAATQFLKLHFKKLPVELAHPLADIPDHLGEGNRWVCVSHDEIADDVEQELGTKLYVMRYYIRRDDDPLKGFSDSEIRRFEGKATNKEQMAELAKLRAEKRGKLDRAIVSFAVTYYTGKADTVAHIPERCYTADGYEPVETKTETWDVNDKQTPDGKLDFRYISFEDLVGTTQTKRNVAYTFHVNGAYQSDPARVRMSLQNLFERYGYYAKVELMVQEPDRDVARATMQEFVKVALPEVERCLPDWNALPKR